MTRRVFFGFLITGSLILNTVFIGMWISHAAPRHFMKYCQNESEENHHGKCPMQKVLAMSDSQWTLLHPKIESIRETTSGLYRELAKNRTALVDELEKTPTDSSALSACKERIVACQRKMQDFTAGHILEEKEMLTLDQRRRFFNTLRANMSCAGFPGMMGSASWKKLREN